MSITYPSGPVTTGTFHRQPLTTATGLIRSSGRLPRPTVERTALDETTTTVAVPVYASETVTDNGADYGTMSDTGEVVTYRYRAGAPAAPVGPTGWPTASGDWPIPTHHTAVEYLAPGESGRAKVVPIPAPAPGTMPQPNPAPAVETVTYDDRTYTLPRPLSGPTATAMLNAARKRDRAVAASRTYYRRRAGALWAEAARLDESGASDRRVIAAVQRAIAASDDVWTIPSRTAPVKSGYGYRPIAGRGGDVLPDDVTRRARLDIGGRAPKSPVGSMVAEWTGAAVEHRQPYRTTTTAHTVTSTGTAALAHALFCAIGAPAPAPERLHVVPTYTADGHRAVIWHKQDAAGMPPALSYASHVEPSGERVYGALLDDTPRAVRRLMAVLTGDWSNVVTGSILPPAIVARCLMAAMGCPTTIRRTETVKLTETWNTVGAPGRILTRGKGTDRGITSVSRPSKRAASYRAADGTVYRAEPGTGRVTTGKSSGSPRATGKSGKAAPAAKRSNLTRSAARDLIRQNMSTGASVSLTTDGK